MKQTAVEWLQKQLECFGNKHELQMSWATVDKLLEQAKQMEKEQIMMAHCHNRCLNNKTYECSIKAFENSEQYYNETFNTKNQ